MESLAWPQFRGHQDRPQGEAGKNGEAGLLPWALASSRRGLPPGSRRYCCSGNFSLRFFFEPERAAVVGARAQVGIGGGDGSVPEGIADERGRGTGAVGVGAVAVAQPMRRGFFLQPRARGGAGEDLAYAFDPDPQHRGFWGLLLP